MTIDTSALCAILFNEDDAPQPAECIRRAPRRRLSAASYLETSLVLIARGGEEALPDLDELIARSSATIEPVTREQAEAARDAFIRFGKGRHPAGLNFGDCFSYALARLSGEPLLFKGNDFTRTDIPNASSQASAR